MSVRGHSETSAVEFRRSAVRIGADIWASLLKAGAVRCYFRKNSLFASIYSLFHPVGNSTANRLLVLESSVHDGADIDEIPCIFPMIREFGLAETRSPEPLSTAT